MFVWGMDVCVELLFVFLFRFQFFFRGMGIGVVLEDERQSDIELMKIV